ncbi:MAG: carboxypeptidase regulatory-like domain-containing protein [Acidobacteriia bacterium]|nr:carboxypeptidase regulatory-like domain-containing protein [Terriglobia bacterium]
MLLRVAVLLAMLAGSAAADTLDGKVVEDHSNNPLASVELRVYRVGVRQLAADLETDATGRFTAPGLPAGDYRIEASKPNYIGATVRLRGVSSGLLIRLVRCGVISGQVVDAASQPVRGAAVYAMPKPADGGPLRAFAPGQGNYVQVNDRGQYRLHDLPPGEYAVAVSYGASTSMFGSSGGATVRAGLGSGVQFYPTNARPQFFTISGGEEYRNTDFAIIPNTLYSVSGKMELAGERLNRVGGVVVRTQYWLALTTEDQPALAAAVTETKLDGSFQFDGIAPGSYNLTASGPIGGYGGKGILGVEPFFGRTRVSVGGANVEGVSISAQKGRSHSFILKSAVSQLPEGACPATAHFTLTALEDWATRLDREAEVNFKKEQTVDHIAPARFQVVLSRLGESCYQPAPAILDFSAALNDAPVAVLVAPAGSLHGKLTGTAKPAGFAVALVSTDSTGVAQPVQVAFPDADGRFVFGSLRPGAYRLTAQPAGEASKARWVSERARMIEIQIAAGAPTDMELPAPPINQNQ